tara:strand:- start:5580 stop:5996 length:417 start_codon:yes stop_codon:yes gene_type:complete
MESWKEIDLFNWLKENVYSDLVKAKNQMSRWDCYSPSTGHRLELKCRKKHYDSLLIEKKKYDAMRTESDKHLDVPMYFNSTPEGVFSFNLNIINPIWETNNKNPATTYWSNSQRIEKEVAYLEIEKSKQWKTQCNKSI